MTLWVGDRVRGRWLYYIGYSATNMLDRKYTTYLRPGDVGCRAQKLALRFWMAGRWYENVSNEKWRESHFKIMHAAIHTFHILPDPSCPERITHCPKCQERGTDLFHGLWACDKVQHYWTQVQSYISQWWDRPLRMSPVTILLHCFLSEDTESDTKSSPSGPFNYFGGQKMLIE